MTEGQRILNRAWNHLWLDSEDSRPLGLENIVLMECYRLAIQEAADSYIHADHCDCVACN